MSESTETYGDFVVACEPIVRREVDRLRRRGAPWVDVDDARQEAFLILLENEDSIKTRDGALATTVVRRRLIRRFIERDHAEKRGGWSVPMPIDAFTEGVLSARTGMKKSDETLRGTKRDSNSGFSSQNLEALSVGQPIESLIDRLTLAELEAVEPIPKFTGCSRQGWHQQRYRWVRRMQRYVAGEASP